MTEAKSIVFNKPCTGGGAVPGCGNTCTVLETDLSSLADKQGAADAITANCKTKIHFKPAATR